MGSSYIDTFLASFRAFEPPLLFFFSYIDYKLRACHNHIFANLACNSSSPGAQCLFEGKRGGIILDPDASRYSQYDCYTLDSKRVITQKPRSAFFQPLPTLPLRVCQNPARFHFLYPSPLSLIHCMTWKKITYILLSTYMNFN